TMSSNGKEMIVVDPSVKRDRKGKTGASSSTFKVGPPRRFEEKGVEPHGLIWFNTKKEPKYAPKNWIDEGRLELEFSAIRDKKRELGECYIFNELEKCNVTLAREFYEN
ncbi:hypothetical protein HAX54_023362, partial [Datura stramonium]|nr:hypothetical protein [Datura stramonium]